MVLGIVTMPLTGRLFREFDDKGWMFSKVLAVVVTGFGTWFLVAVKLLKFTSLTCIGVTLACGAGCLLLGKAQHKKGIECLPVNHLDLVYWEEILFFVFFLLWTYLAGFHPAAYGTEKFMDYGFMEAMMRSTTLPAVAAVLFSGRTGIRRISSIRSTLPSICVKDSEIYMILFRTPEIAWTIIR